MSVLVIGLLERCPFTCGDMEGWKSGKMEGFLKYVSGDLETVREYVEFKEGFGREMKLSLASIGSTVMFVGCVYNMTHVVQFNLLIIY